jgi:hypothetical protein
MTDEQRHPSSAATSLWSSLSRHSAGIEQPKRRVSAGGLIMDYLRWPAVQGVEPTEYRKIFNSDNRTRHVIPSQNNRAQYEADV